MEKKIELLQAKEIIGSDKVFINPNGGLNYAYYGKYAPGITLIIPDTWTLDSNGTFESPMKFCQCDEIVKNMNIDFNGNVTVLFGDFWISKTSKPCFKITSPINAKFLFLKCSWGGAFNSTRGQTTSYAKEVGATWFTVASSNGGGAGYDYWVLPVGFVAFSEPRDVSSILESYHKKEIDRVKRNEEIYFDKITKEEASRKLKKSFEERILKVKEFLENADNCINYCYSREISLHDTFFKHGWRELQYTEENVQKLENVVEEIKEKTVIKEFYEPKFHEYDSILKVYGYIISATIDCVSICGKSFEYSHDGLIGFSDYVLEIQKEKQKEENERIKKLVEAQALARKIELERQAAEAGLPQNFSFWTREGGMTGLSKAYVVQADGTFREPDQFDHRMYKSDGTEIWNQILPDELVITYTKECTAKPFVCEVFFKPEVITEAQRESIEELRISLTAKFKGCKGLVSGKSSPECQGWDI